MRCRTKAQMWTEALRAHGVCDSFVLYYIEMLITKSQGSVVH
jgi:hypothetical protein